MKLELKIPQPFLQKHYEKFNLELRKISGDDDAPIAIYRGDMVRAAAVCGWLEGVKKADISEIEAKEVLKLADEISTLFVELVEVSKN